LTPGSDRGRGQTSVRDRARLVSVIQRTHQQARDGSGICGLALCEVICNT
jgi:hypothetical protein